MPGGRVIGPLRTVARSGPIGSEPGARETEGAECDYESFEASKAPLESSQRALCDAAKSGSMTSDGEAPRAFGDPPATEAHFRFIGALRVEPQLRKRVGKSRSHVEFSTGVVQS